LNGTNLNQRIFVAGGGGGGACSGCTGGGINGGAGGGLSGADGANSSCFPNLDNGKGGTQVAGGLPGKWGGGCTNADTGSVGVGGRGQDSASCSGGVTCGSGGGGGGGYYGGGGGGNAGGGGGSNYASPSATAVTHTQGTQVGNGVVAITYLDPTAVHNVSNSEGVVSVYPNPFSDNVFVKITNANTTAEITVVNLLGEKVMSVQSRGEQTMLELSNLESGIYFIKVQLPDLTFVNKVIKR